LRPTLAAQWPATCHLPRRARLSTLGSCTGYPEQVPSGQEQGLSGVSTLAAVPGVRRLWQGDSLAAARATAGEPIRLAHWRSGPSTDDHLADDSGRGEQPYDAQREYQGDRANGPPAPSAARAKDDPSQRRESEPLQEEPWLAEEQVLRIGGSAVDCGLRRRRVVDAQPSGQAQNFTAPGALCAPSGAATAEAWRSAAPRLMCASCTVHGR
jgi:hypothetical protein